jgi:Fe2+ or Zn2+ uptake regulation protein
METDKVVSALNSELRREILKIISREPMTVIQVLEELRKRKFEVKYRESVYRALEKLFNSGLVEKCYIKERGLCYKLKASLIIIDLTKGTTETNN